MNMSDKSLHPFEQFRADREAGNEKALDTDSLLIKRFFGLDKTYRRDQRLRPVHRYDLHA